MVDQAQHSDTNVSCPTLGVIVFHFSISSQMRHVNSMLAFVFFTALQGQKRSICECPNCTVEALLIATFYGVN